MCKGNVIVCHDTQQDAYHKDYSQLVRIHGNKGKAIPITGRRGP
jgi:hypothetical protein